jgi:hypothetical protein
MRFYPDIPARRLRTLVRDLLVLILFLCFALIGKWVHDVVDQLAVLGEGVRKAGSAVPFVGNPVEDLGRRGEEEVHRLANLLGSLFFALPALALLVWYWPRRMAQIRTLTAASRVLAGANARLVAMRAAFSLPYGQLLAYTRDPLGDLAAEHYEPLVAAALEDAGLLPQRQRRTKGEEQHARRALPADRDAVQSEEPEAIDHHGRREVAGRDDPDRRRLADPWRGERDADHDQRAAERGAP